MTQHVIHVKLKKGAISVSPDPLKMLPWDEVAWKVEDGGRLRIEFEGATPFDDRVLDNEKATRPSRPRDEARHGDYKYTVVDDGDPTNRLDPKIIIDPPPTGGTSGP